MELLFKHEKSKFRLNYILKKNHLNEKFVKTCADKKTRGEVVILCSQRDWGGYYALNAVCVLSWRLGMIEELHRIELMYVVSRSITFIVCYSDTYDEATALCRVIRHWIPQLLKVCIFFFLCLESILLKWCIVFRIMNSCIVIILK